MKLDCLPIKDMRLDDIKGASLFGERIHPVTKKQSMHYGIDRSCPVSTPILAAIDGTVAVSKLQNGGGGFGEYIVIEKDGNYALCAHLSRRIVRTGQRVMAGQVIGFSGNTGRSTGPHLHFGLCRNYNKASANKSDWTDPLPLLKELKEKKVKKVKRYNYIEELPKGLQEEAQELVDSRVLVGENGKLDVTEDMIRVMIVNKRYNDNFLERLIVAIKGGE